MKSCALDVTGLSSTKAANATDISLALASIASPLRRRGPAKCFTSGVAPSTQLARRSARNSTAPEPSTPLVPRAARLSTPQTGAHGTSPAAQVALAPLGVLAAGAGGVDELRTKLDDGAISWALLRFQVGHGTFTRSKLVSIHCNGHATPVMMRGWLNGRSAEAFALLGDSHASIEITAASDLTVEKVCERLLPLFAADNIGMYSSAALQQEYIRMVAESQRKPRKLEMKVEEHVCDVKVDMSLPQSAEDALRAAGSEEGDVNWVLLEPDRLRLHSTGRGGIEEMKKSLDPNKVLFGVCRLSFGEVRASTALAPTGEMHIGISKCVLVHWVGPQVGAVKRGIWNSKLQHMSALASASCAIAFKREAHCLRDLQIEDIVSELRRLTVLDGVRGSMRSAGGRITVDAYLAALELEARRRITTEAMSPEVKDLKEDIDLSAAVTSVREMSGSFNWALCGCTDLPVPVDRPTPRRMFSS